MNDRAKGPRQPFLDEHNEPRAQPALTSTGPLVVRTGQLLVNLDHQKFAAARETADAAAEALTAAVQRGLRRGREMQKSDDPRFRATFVDSPQFDEVAFKVDRDDWRQGLESSWMRVRFSPLPVDVIGLLRVVHLGLQDDDTPVGTEAVRANTVFLVGALTADPMRIGSIFGADPMRIGSAYGVDPMRIGYTSTARPAVAPATLTPCPLKSEGPGAVTVAILDTGSPVDGDPKAGDVDFVCLPQPIRERPDINADAYLDLAAGHTTFIRTIIQRGCPEAQIMIEGVMHNDGDGDEADIAAALQRVHQQVADKSTLILNLSFSGYYDGDEEPPLIAYWLRRLMADGAVVVAAAGNDGDCRPKYPAALPGVIAVAAMGPCGPAGFSNHGRWVDACAPGEDLVSEFFAFDGALEATVPGSVPDIDHFVGWATWSGTSFSTPTVVAALAELVVKHTCTAREAVERLIGRPGLLRVPDYGVVVNRVF